MVDIVLYVYGSEHPLLPVLPDTGRSICYKQVNWASLDDLAMPTASVVILQTDDAFHVLQERIASLRLALKMPHLPVLVLFPSQRLLAENTGILTQYRIDCTSLEEDLKIVLARLDKLLSEQHTRQSQVAIELEKEYLNRSWRHSEHLRIQAENALRHAEMKADQVVRVSERAVQAKNEFLANMSHEIRTPLHAIIGMSGLLLEMDQAADQREYTDIICGAGRALLQVVNDVLDFSKIEAGKLEFESASFQLRALLEESMDVIAFEASKKSLSLALIVEPTLSDVMIGDSLRIKQIMVNLLGNAVKFTESGEVVLKAAMQESANGEVAKVLFEVRDSGIGIAKHHIPKLFEAFKQVDSTTTRRFGGSGLGLAIVQRLVTAMGGTITVSSTPGQGSVFSVTMPIQMSNDAKDQEVSGKSESSDKLVIVIDRHKATRDSVVALARYYGIKSLECSELHEVDQYLESLTEGKASVPGHIDTRNANVWILMEKRALVHETDCELLHSISTRLRSQSRQLKLISLEASVDCNHKSQCQVVAMDDRLSKPLKSFQFASLLLNQAINVTESNTQEQQINKSNTELLGRVLLVEDIVVNQRVSQSMLERLHYSCDIVASGEEALEHLMLPEALANPYDVILLDCHLPGIDGFTTAERIRSHEKYKIIADIPIIALTASVLNTDRKRSMAAGMNAYLSKPVSLEQLQSTLNHLLNNTPRKRKKQNTLHVSSNGYDSAISSNVCFDKKRFDEIGGGDVVFIQEILTAFFEDMEDNLNSFSSVVEASDTEGCQYWAHAIKGASANIGAVEMQAIAAKMEKQLKISFNEHIASDYELLRTALERFKAEVQGLFPLSI